MRNIAFGRVDESAGGHGWVQISRQQWRAGLGADRSPRNWTAIEYTVGRHTDLPPEQNLELIPPLILVRAGQRSCLSPRVARMLVGRIYPLGVVRRVRPLLRGIVRFERELNLLGEGGYLPFPAPQEAPVDLTEVDPRHYGRVLEAVGETEVDMALELSTERMIYQFWMDEDDYFWVSSKLRAPYRSADDAHLYDHDKYYRADQEEGLESLIAHLLRSGADWVPANALGLAPGDMVEHERFGLAKVLSVTGNRCRMRFAEPFSFSPSAPRRQEVEFSTEKVRLRVAP